MKKIFRLEAPDGGWGILVCFGMAMPFICILGSLPSFGLIYRDFLKGIGAETSAIAFATSAIYSALSFSILFANRLFKKFTIRRVGIFGALLYIIGSVMQIFVQTYFQLIVAYSLFQGIASGLMVSTAYTTFNNYFVKRRVMMMSFAKALIAIGTMFYPLVVQKLSEWYGFRGCLIVLAGINSHALLGMIVMHPVEWHMKKTEIVTDDAEFKKDPPDPLLNAKDLEEQISLDINTKDKSLYAVTTIDNQGELTEMTVLSDESVEKLSQPKKTTCWQVIVDFLDLSLLKDPIYLNAALGMAFAMASDTTFFTLQPLYLLELNYTKKEAANIIAIGAAADLGSRIFLIVSAIFITISTRYIFLTGTFLMIVARLAFLEVFDFFYMAIVTAIMGFLRTWIIVTSPLVIGDILPKERFTSGYALLMFIKGNLTFLIGPFAGYLRDITNNYFATFHCLNFFMALCVISWIIEIVYLEFRKEKKADSLKK